jgi:transcriptional repressor OPI1
VVTIRQVVEIISNYAGSALAEPARTRVRNFILSLPQRWANANSGENSAASSTVPPPPHGGEAQSVVAESSAREEMKARRRPRGSSRGSNVVTVNKRAITSPERNVEQLDAEQAQVNVLARRIMTLATESLDMLHNVTTIFSQSLERAEAYVPSIRFVRIKAKSQTGGSRDYERRA